MKTIQQYLLIGLLGATVAGCATKAPGAPARITEIRDYRATFLCDDNQQFQVRFSPYSAVLEVQGASVAMTQQPAADGFQYAGGGQILRAQGPAATWTDDKGAPHHCREIAAPKNNTAVR